MSVLARRILRFKAAYALASNYEDRMNMGWLSLTLQRLFNEMQESAA